MRPFHCISRGRTAAEPDSHGCVCPPSGCSPTISSLDQIRMIDRKQEVGAAPKYTLQCVPSSAG